MIDYICVGLVACYMTYHANKCATKRSETQENETTHRTFLRLL